MRIVKKENHTDNQSPIFNALAQYDQHKQQHQYNVFLCYKQHNFVTTHVSATVASAHFGSTKRNQ
jgi:hypothetical protein